MGFTSLFGSQEGLFTLFARIMIIFTATPIHEYAHAWMAYKLGDDTASLEGRLDLNPLVHMDPVGAMLILLTGFGWAKPVPVRPNRFNRNVSLRGGMVLTALAGPLSNILMAFLLLIIYKVLWFAPSLVPVEVISMILWNMVSINVGLAVFNLMPIPPLDGYNIVSYWIPGKWDYKLAQLLDNPMARLLVLMLLISVLSLPLSILSGWIMSGLNFLTQPVQTLGLLLTGSF